MSQLSATATELILQSGEEELGVNGNFALAAGFLNARSYFWDIFQVSQKDSQSEEGKEEA
jgi:hypothetical protein